MPELIHISAVNAGAIGVLVSLLWCCSIRRRDTGIVDPFWGTGFVVVAWTTAFQWWRLGHEVHRLGWLLVALTTAWGLRLSLYLLWRNWGEGEDRRYAQMRQHHGERFWWVSFFTVFALQGLILWVVSWPIQAGIASTGFTVSWAAGVGGIVWTIGIFFEAVGDWQMARFKARPDTEGQVMHRGLWQYTRHPNYFGDFCVWWGIYLVACDAGAWWTVVSPLLMSFLLTRVSGVTLLETDISERRPAYREYRRRTNAFFPGPRRNTND
ncbi:MAG: DUF1295 domain-containing protein [Planctomycetales bacterium]|nr:DUF1295 domain-containing protein [Planctomycetales bacterium]